MADIINLDKFRKKKIKPKDVEKLKPTKVYKKPETIQEVCDRYKYIY